MANERIQNDVDEPILSMTNDPEQQYKLSMTPPIKRSKTIKRVSHASIDIAQYIQRWHNPEQLWKVKKTNCAFKE